MKKILDLELCNVEYDLDTGDVTFKMLDEYAEFVFTSKMLNSKKPLVLDSYISEWVINQEELDVIIKWIALFE